jgi:tetratricopeptide (TPR) repeat protein
MHDLVRLYAHQQLTKYTDTDDPGGATARLLSYYRHTAAAANEHLRAVPGQAVSNMFASYEAAVAWFDAERASLTAVALALGTSHAALTTTLATCLAEYQAWRRQLTAQVAVAQDALTAAHQLEDPQQRTTAWNNLGAALLEVWRFDETISAYEKTPETAHGGDRRGEGEAWNNLGLALLGVGRFDEAITAFDQAVGICRVIGDRHGEGLAWNYLGLALQEVDRVADAQQAGIRAVEAFVEIADSQSEQVVRQWLDDLL